MDGVGLAANGRAGKRARHRAGARARHFDARRVAGGEGRQRLPRRDRAAFGRDQPGIAAGPGAAAARSRPADARGTAALAEVPGGPSIIIANEFIDALPVHQAVKQDDGWHERVVDIAPDGKFVIGAAREPLPFFEAAMPRGLRDAAGGRRSMNGAPTILRSNWGERVRNEGAALIIDYGHAHYGLGDTLQAVVGHSFTDPLRAPGHADLDRACRFRGAGAVRGKHGCAHSRADPAARPVPAARHRDNAPRRLKRARRRTKRPTSSSRSRG